MTAAEPAARDPSSGRRPDDWHTDNQRFLVAALTRLRHLLEQHADNGRSGCSSTGMDRTVADELPSDGDSDTQRLLDRATAGMSAPPALDALFGRLQLTAFERDVLLLCAAIELDSSFGSLCATLQGQPGSSRARPNFGLALAALPGAHWSALMPTAPLRWFQLVELGSGEGVTAAPLHIDERVLHALVGLDYLDERVASMIFLVQTPPPVPASHQVLAGEIAVLIARGADPPPVFQLTGKDAAAKLEIAATAAQAIGLRVVTLPASALPASSGELDALARLCTREALLGGLLFLVDCERAGSQEASQSVHCFVERLAVPVLVTVRDRLSQLRRPVVTFDVSRPNAAEQSKLWMEMLAECGAYRTERVDLIYRLTTHFDLSASTIRAACTAASGRLALGAPIADAFWTSARSQARARFDDLAQRIEARSRWGDLVLPEPQLAVLRQMTLHARHRMRVYEIWGFGGRHAQGCGISALFTGPSGTGKTLAAEVIASELDLDLYRIDLSQVVSKYIGDTERNLRRVFDAAEEAGAILVFDEADALFGKRTEVTDSHDRFANIEVSYLLQRMEAYRGLAILTTNFRSALDTAFLRRIRFYVQFPFPSVQERAEIWRRVFPDRAPINALDIDRLSRLNIAGGTIRNIAVNAAFLAADSGRAVGMAHLLRAAHTEYAKLERPITAAEFADWPTSE